MSTTWAYVGERAKRGNRACGCGFRALIPDLLRSMVAPAGADSRAQRIALLPIIVHTLREGLLLIEWHAGQQQLAPDWLVEAHRLALF